VADSGIQGIVLLGPMCPVEQASSPCPDKPIAATVRINGPQGETTVRSGSDGRFQAALAPGHYTLQADRLQPIRTSKPIDVIVFAGRWTFDCAGGLGHPLKQLPRRPASRSVSPLRTHTAPSSRRAGMSFSLRAQGLSPALPPTPHTREGQQRAPPTPRAPTPGRTREPGAEPRGATPRRTEAPGRTHPVKTRPRRERGGGLFWMRRHRSSGHHPRRPVPVKGQRVRGGSIGVVPDRPGIGRRQGAHSEEVTPRAGIRRGDLGPG
jgi:hypothetical protein